MNEQLANDVASASAVYLLAYLEELMLLPEKERFRRLEDIFRTTIVAYLESTRNWDIPEPSRN